MLENKDKYLASRGNYLNSFLASLFTLMLGLFTGVLLARGLGPQGRGELAGISFIFTSSGSLIGTFISAQSIISQLLINKRINGINLLIIFMGILGAVLSLIFYYIFNDNINYNNNYIIILVLLTFTQVIYQSSCAVQRGLGNFNIVSISIGFISGVYFLCLYLLFYFNYMTVFSVLLASLFPIFFSSIFLMYKLNGWGKLNILTFMGYLKSGHSFFYLSLMALSIASIDKVLLLKLSNLTELGFYAVSAGLASPLIILAETIVQISFVEVSGSKISGDGVRVALSRFRIGQASLILFGLGLILIGPWFITFVFGSEFNQSILPFILLVFAMVFRGQWLFLDNSLQALNLKKSSFIVSLIGLMAMALTGFFLVPTMGSNGAAISLLVGYIVMFISQVAMWRYELGVRWCELWGLNYNTIAPLFSLAKIKLKEFL